MYCFFSPTIAPYVTTTQSPEMTVKETTPRPTKESGKKHQSGQPGGKGYAPKKCFYSLMNYAIPRSDCSNIIHCYTVKPPSVDLAITFQSGPDVFIDTKLTN